MSRKAYTSYICDRCHDEKLGRVNTYLPKDWREFEMKAPSRAVPGVIYDFCPDCLKSFFVWQEAVALRAETAHAQAAGSVSTDDKQSLQRS
jgi:ribosomal protein L34E